MFEKNNNSESKGNEKQPEFRRKSAAFCLFLVPFPSEVENVDGKASHKCCFLFFSIYYKRPQYVQNNHSPITIDTEWSSEMIIYSTFTTTKKTHQR